MCLSVSKKERKKDKERLSVLCDCFIFSLFVFRGSTAEGTERKIQEFRSKYTQNLATNSWTASSSAAAAVTAVTQFESSRRGSGRQHRNSVKQLIANGNHRFRYAYIFTLIISGRKAVIHKMWFHSFHLLLLFVVGRCFVSFPLSLSLDMFLFFYYLVCTAFTRSFRI